MKSVLRYLMIMLLIGAMAGAVYAQQQNGEAKFVYDDHSKRDPFWTLVKNDGSIINYDNDFLITDLVLEGVTLGASGKNFAIINDKVVKEKDIIGQFTVLKIEKNRVVLEKENQEFSLYLKKEE
ncbi:MAG: hypothetical protein HQL24_00315 [Candidatus Omnitrophica bacterium]|nr:hypothetical protein [Candidatus Omnitrophota bacterium]